MFNKPPLSPELLESMFARMVVTWGRDFTTMYEGVDPEAVKADWADKLRGYQLDTELGDQPQAPAIGWALDHLPDKPLNAVAFRKLCSQYMAPGRPALPASPRPVPASVRQALQALATPSSDIRPERVRNAERYIAMWGGEHQKLTPMQRVALVDMRRILEREASHAQ